MHLSLENDGVLPTVSKHVSDWLAAAQASGNPPSSASSVCVCGHSLGAGYAVLTAASLLSVVEELSCLAQPQGKKQTPHAGLAEKTPLRVVTFGQPQVFAALDSSSPLEGNAVWRALHAVTVNVVNRHDMVPRLPSSEGWMFGDGAIITSQCLPGVSGFAAGVVLGSGRPLLGSLEKNKQLLLPMIAVGNLLWLKGSYFGSVSESDAAIAKSLLSDVPSASVLTDKTAVLHDHRMSAGYIPNLAAYVVLERSTSLTEAHVAALGSGQRKFADFLANNPSR